MILVESQDFVVRQADLPHKCPAATMIDEDGRGNIYVNPEAPIRAVKHELSHLLKGDHYKKSRKIQKIESESVQINLRDVDGYLIAEEDRHGT